MDTEKTRWFKLNEDSESGEDSPYQHQHSTSSSSSSTNHPVVKQSTETREITLRAVSQSEPDLSACIASTSQLARRLFGNSSNISLQQSSSSVLSSQNSSASVSRQLSQSSGISESALRSVSSSISEGSEKSQAVPHRLFENPSRVDVQQSLSSFLTSQNSSLSVSRQGSQSSVISEAALRSVSPSTSHGSENSGTGNTHFEKRVWFQPNQSSTSSSQRSSCTSLKAFTQHSTQSSLATNLTEDRYTDRGELSQYAVSLSSSAEKSLSQHSVLSSLPSQLSQHSLRSEADNTAGTPLESCCGNLSQHSWTSTVRSDVHRAADVFSCDFLSQQQQVLSSSQSADLTEHTLHSSQESNDQCFELPSSVRCCNSAKNYSTSSSERGNRAGRLSPVSNGDLSQHPWTSTLRKEYSSAEVKSKELTDNSVSSNLTFQPLTAPKSDIVSQSGLLSSHLSETLSVDRVSSIRDRLQAIDPPQPVVTDSQTKTLLKAFQSDSSVSGKLSEGNACSVYQSDLEEWAPLETTSVDEQSQTTVESPHGVLYPKSVEGSGTSGYITHNSSASREFCATDKPLVQAKSDTTFQGQSSSDSSVSRLCVESRDLTPGKADAVDSKGLDGRTTDQSQLNSFASGSIRLSRGSEPTSPFHRNFGDFANSSQELSQNQRLNSDITKHILPKTVLISEPTKHFSSLEGAENESQSDQTKLPTAKISSLGIRKSSFVEKLSEQFEPAVLREDTQVVDTSRLSGFSYYPLTEDTCSSQNSTNSLKMSFPERDGERECADLSQVPSLSFNDSSKDSTSLPTSSPMGTHRYISSDEDWKSETDGNTSETDAGSPSQPIFTSGNVGVSQEAVSEALSGILHEQAVQTIVSEISNDFVSGNLSMDGRRSSDSSQLSSDRDDAAVDREFRGSVSGLYPETYGGLSDVDWNIYTSNESDNNSPRSIPCSGERDTPIGGNLSYSHDTIRSNNSMIEVESKDTLLGCQDDKDGEDRRGLEVKTSQNFEAIVDGETVQSTDSSNQDQYGQQSNSAMDIISKLPGNKIDTGSESYPQDSSPQGFEPKMDPNNSSSSESGRGSGSKSASLSEDYNVTKHDEMSFYSEYSRENSNISDVMSTDEKLCIEQEAKEAIEKSGIPDTDFVTRSTERLAGYTPEYVTVDDRLRLMTGQEMSATEVTNSFQQGSLSQDMYKPMEISVNSEYSPDNDKVSGESKSDANLKEENVIQDTVRPSPHGKESSGESLAAIPEREDYSRLSYLSIEQIRNSEHCRREGQGDEKTKSLSADDISLSVSPQSRKSDPLIRSAKSGLECNRSLSCTDIGKDVTKSQLEHVSDTDSQRPEHMSIARNDTSQNTAVDIKINGTQSVKRYEASENLEQSDNIELVGFGGAPEFSSRGERSCLTMSSSGNLTGFQNQVTQSVTLTSETGPGTEFLSQEHRSSTPAADCESVKGFSNLNCRSITPVCDTAQNSGLALSGRPCSAPANIETGKEFPKDSKRSSTPLTEGGLNYAKQIPTFPGGTKQTMSLADLTAKSSSSFPLDSRERDIIKGETGRNQRPVLNNLSTPDRLNSSLKTTIDHSSVMSPSTPGISDSEDEYRSSDDLSRKVESLLTHTAHLAEQVQGYRSETARGSLLPEHVDSPRDIDYDSLHRELDEIEDSLKPSTVLHHLSELERIDLENSTVSTTPPKLSYRSACGTASPTSVSDLDTSRRRFLWDYGADIGYDDGQGRFIGNIKDITGTEESVTRSHTREHLTGFSSRGTTPLFELDRTNDTLTDQGEVVLMPECSKSVIKMDEAIGKERYGHGRKSVELKEAVPLTYDTRPIDVPNMSTPPLHAAAGSTNRPLPATSSLSDRVNELLDREDPNKQAVSILRDVSAEEKVFLRQMAQDYKGSGGSESDTSSSTTPKISPRKGIQVSPRMHKNPQPDRFLRSPTLQRILEKNAAASDDLRRSNQPPEYHSALRSYGSSAFSNAKSFLSGQLEKMSARQFDQSIELYSPVRRAIECYPVYLTESRDASKQDTQTKEAWGDETCGRVQQQETDPKDLSRPHESPSVETDQRRAAGDRPIPTGSADGNTTPRGAGQWVQGPASHPQSLTENSDRPMADYQTPQPNLQRFQRAAQKNSPVTSDPASSPSEISTTSPSDSDYTAAKKNSLIGPHYRPYRPVGSTEVYYTESETDDRMSGTDSVTTVESTHPGSDDARAPEFPLHAFGTRQEGVPGSVGIYGNRKPRLTKDMQSVTSLSTIEEKSQTDERERTQSLERLDQISVEHGRRENDQARVRSADMFVSDVQQNGPSPRTQAVLNRVDRILQQNRQSGNRGQGLNRLMVRGDSPEFDHRGEDHKREDKRRMGSDSSDKAFISYNAVNNSRQDCYTNFSRPMTNGDFRDQHRSDNKNQGTSEQNQGRYSVEVDPLAKSSRSDPGTVTSDDAVRVTAKSTPLSANESLSKAFDDRPNRSTERILSKSLEDLSFTSHEVGRGSSSLASHAISPPSLYRSPILSQSAANTPVVQSTGREILNQVQKTTDLSHKLRDYVSVSERNRLTGFSPLPMDDEEDGTWPKSSLLPHEMLVPSDVVMREPRKSAYRPQSRESRTLVEEAHLENAMEDGSDLVDFDQVPISRMARLVQDSIQKGTANSSGVGSNINLFWERFQQMQNDSDSSMDSGQLNALVDLIRNPAKHVVKQYLCEQEVERRRRQAWVENEREERRKLEAERKRLAKEAKRQKIVDGSYSETLEDSNGYSSERSRDERGLRKNDKSWLKPYQRELSYDSSVVDTLYSIPEDPSLDYGRSPSSSSDKYHTTAKPTRRQRHVIDPHMQKLKNKISKQRLKYEKQKRKEAQRLAKIQRLEELLAAKKYGKISSKTFEMEVANLSSSTARTSSSEMSSELSQTSTMVTAQDMSSDLTPVSTQLSSQRSTSTITPRSTTDESTLTDLDWLNSKRRKNNLANVRQTRQARTETAQTLRSRQEMFSSPVRRREGSVEKTSPQRRKRSALEDPPFVTQEVQYDRPSPSARPSRSPTRQKAYSKSEKNRKQKENERSRTTKDAAVMYPSPLVPQRKKSQQPRMVSHAVQTTPRAPEKIGSKRSSSKSPVRLQRSSVERFPSQERTGDKVTRHRSVSPERRQSRESENKPPKKNRRSAPAASSGIAWFVPVEETRPWRKPLKERQAYALSRHPYHNGSKSDTFSDWKNSMNPVMFPRRKEQTLDEEKSDAESFLEIYLTKSRNEQKEMENSNIGLEDLKPLSKMSLQEAFQKFKSDVASRSKERQRRIALAAEERRLQEMLGAERAQLFMDQRFLEGNRDYHPLSENLFKPKKRSISKQEMKELTARLYQKLPEVVQKKLEEERAAEYKVNRIRAKIFNKKVQRKVLGKPSPWYA